MIVEATDGGGKTAQALVVVSTSGDDATRTTMAQPNITPSRTFVTEVNEATPPNSVVVSLGVSDSFCSVKYL